MEQSPTAKKRRHWGLIALSAIDLITGILSLIFTALAVQVVALMASGATLVSAVKIAVQSEKAAVFVKPVAIFAVRKLTRSEKMKAFFEKLKKNAKNNPLTISFSMAELVICGGLGYAMTDFFGQFAWAVGWKLYLVAYGAAAVIYSALLAFTIILGHDGDAFAAVRRFVKNIGGDKAVEVLDKADTEVRQAVAEAEAARRAEIEAEEAARAAEAERKAKEDEIYKYALEQEEKKREAAEAQKRAILVNRYKDEFAAKNATDEDK